MSVETELEEGFEGEEEGRKRTKSLCPESKKGESALRGGVKDG